MLSTLADLSIFSVLLVLAMAFCGVSVFSFPFTIPLCLFHYFFYNCCHLHWLELLLDHLLNMRRMTVQFIR
ncbi:hypothetical protein BY996DRAFT_7675347 [Phakopsora pachyrhizi]|nr:hypothetical protein BY996DRAFT_7675347 [Phakopsora pachyrhizi]